MTKSRGIRPHRNRREYEATEAKVLAYLQDMPAGTQVKTAQIAAVLGLTSGGMKRVAAHLMKCPSLRWQRIAGRKDRSYWWSLAEFEPIELDEEEEDDTVDPLPRKTEAPWIQPRPGLLFPGVYAVREVA